ncbi:MAG TPA: TRAP transporter large permease [Burkholderiales bacterium]|nr:TRAP transporter large permease [Burkholderiales bacterium]
MTQALIAFAAMLALTFARVPIAFAMGVVGIAGTALLKGWSPALAMATEVTYETGFSYLFSVVPLFILMGTFVTRAGMAEELYAACYAFIGHRRGGLAMATIGACGGFGAICGSSLATAATMSQVAMPSMRKFGYSPALGAGSIAAGGTLGILIPPSTVMVIYGILTNTSIGKLFAAGVLPGLIGILFYIGAVQWTTWRDPKAGPPGERVPWKQRMATLRGIGPFLGMAAVLIALARAGVLQPDDAMVLGALGTMALAFVYKGVISVVALFTLVMGGIYGGVFTPTEAAGVGATGAFAFALARRRLSWNVLYHVLMESGRTTAMLFVILIGAMIFANFINYTSMPGDLRHFVHQFEIRPLLVVAAICVIYILLGCVLESISMILLTVPVFYPLVQHLGFDLVWFGIVVVVVTEISLITPPVGMNVFVLRTLLPDVPTRTVFRGVLPFIVADFFRLALLVGVPAISLLLPKYMG